MPELPEVETIRRGLEKKLPGKTIADFDSDWHKAINRPLAAYRRLIKGLKIKKVWRRAKMLGFDLSQGKKLLFHLKMTGQLVYRDKHQCLIGGHPVIVTCDQLPNKFTHAIFTFTDKSKLFFNDVRKFGWVRLFSNIELKKVLSGLEMGPEPLGPDFSIAYLKQAAKRKARTKVKQFIMDPKVVVGVGNIYSDEVCFFAKVRPDRLVKDLTEKELKLIHDGIVKILTASIKAQGTTFSNYVNSNGESGAYTKQLKVYGRYGQKCSACGSIVRRIKINGRTSSYCPVCQR